MKENSKYVLNVLNDAITMNVVWSFQDSKKNVKNSIKFVWQYIYIKKISVVLNKGARDH